MTHLKALYGRESLVLVKYEHNPQDPISVQEILCERDAILQELKTNMLKARQYTKSLADKKRRPMELEVVDVVLVKLQSYRHNSVALRKSQKLGLRYFGPLFIVNKLNFVAYKLQLPQHARIHPIFHVSLLKKIKDDTSTPYLPLPLFTSELGPIISDKDNQVR